MKSGFQFSYILIKIVMALLGIVLAFSPLVILYWFGFSNDGIGGAVGIAVVGLPFVYLIFKDFPPIAITLNEQSMRFDFLFTSITDVYNYEDIVSIKGGYDVTEGYSRYRGPFSIYDKEVTITFNDENEIMLFENVYANVPEMVAYIKSRRKITNIEG
ncbi:MAG TPA: hypothetical protein VG603_15700 [Chitinophagales bacterium]|nr:hypothetical protein [Chitinophagales bacterium]